MLLSYLKLRNKLDYKKHKVHYFDMESFKEL